MTKVLCTWIQISFKSESFEERFYGSDLKSMANIDNLFRDGILHQIFDATIPELPDHVFLKCVLDYILFSNSKNVEKSYVL